jgi:hypothetical protein
LVVVSELDLAFRDYYFACDAHVRELRGWANYVADERIADERVDHVRAWVARKRAAKNLRRYERAERAKRGVRG